MDTNITMLIALSLGLGFFLLFFVILASKEWMPYVGQWLDKLFDFGRYAINKIDQLIRDLVLKSRLENSHDSTQGVDPRTYS